MINLYGNSIWNNVTHNSEKSVFTVESKKVNDFVQILEEGKFNYCYYEKNNSITFAISKNDEKILSYLPIFKNVEIGNSNKNKSVSNIIGNVNYKDILPNNRFFKKFQEKDLALQCAYELKKRNIAFSGRIYDNSVVLTVNKENSTILNEIASDIQRQEKKFAEKLKNIAEIEKSIDKYFSNSQKETTIRNLVDICYQMPLGYSVRLSSDLNNEFIKQYSPEDLKEFARIFDKCYRDLNDADMYFPKQSQIQELQEFKIQKEKEYTFYSLIEGKGYSYEQQQAIKNLVDDDIDTSIISIIDYEFSADDILKVNDLWKSSKSLPSLSFTYEFTKLISDVKNQSFQDIDKKIREDVYQPKQAFSEEDYLIENYTFVEELNTYKIPIKLNNGIVNRLNNKNMDSSSDIENNYILEFVTNEEHYLLMIYDADGYFVNSFNAKDIFNAKEIMILSNIMLELQTIEKEKAIFKEFVTKKFLELNNFEIIRDIYKNSSYDEFELKVKEIISDTAMNVPGLDLLQVIHFVNHYYFSEETRNEISRSIAGKLCDIFIKFGTYKQEDFLEFEKKQNDLIKNKAKDYVEQQELKINKLLNTENENNYEEIRNIYQKIIPISEKYQIELSIIDKYPNFLKDIVDNQNEVVDSDELFSEIDTESNELISEPENTETDNFIRNIEEKIDEEFFDDYDEISLDSPISEQEQKRDILKSEVENLTGNISDKTSDEITELITEKENKDIIEEQISNTEGNSDNKKTLSFNDLKIGDKFLYYNREYTVSSLSGLYPNDICVSYTEKLSGGFEYKMTTNMDWKELVSNGKYIEISENNITNQSKTVNSIPDVEVSESNINSQSETINSVSAPNLNSNSLEFKQQTFDNLKEKYPIQNTGLESSDLENPNLSDISKTENESPTQENNTTKISQNYSEFVGKTIVLDTQNGSENLIISSINSYNNTATVLNNNVSSMKKKTKKRKSVRNVV